MVVSTCVTVMASQLLAPRNVQLTSYNMDLRLRWSPPLNVTGEVLYSTQLWTSSQVEPREACVNTTALHCVLSDPSLPLHIIEFGQYKASVRAQCGKELSEWVTSKAISMDRDTVIGPPEVSLTANGADVEVIMKNPMFRVSTLPKVYSQHQYNISYWPQGRQDMAAHVLVQQNQAVLSDLEPHSDYCVQARVLVEPARNQNPTEASEPVCVTTSNKPPAPWRAAVLTFFALLLAVALGVVVFVYHKQIYYFFYPKDSLPQHLPDCPHSLSHLMPGEEVYHPLSVVPCQAIEESTIPDSS